MMRTLNVRRYWLIVIILLSSCATEADDNNIENSTYCFDIPGCADCKFHIEAKGQLTNYYFTSKNLKNGIFYRLKKNRGIIEKIIYRNDTALAGKQFFFNSENKIDSIIYYVFDESKIDNFHKTELIRRRYTDAFFQYQLPIFSCDSNKGQIKITARNMQVLLLKSTEGNTISELSRKENVGLNANPEATLFLGYLPERRYYLMLGNVLLIRESEDRFSSYAKMTKLYFPVYHIDNGSYNTIMSITSGRNLVLF